MIQAVAFYIKDENYFIDTEEIDQIYDGDKFYTIIHENQEIIVSDKDNTFFNFTPKQIFNYFLNGFELEIEKLLNNSYLIIAENNQEDIFYSIVINSANLSIEKIEMIEKKSNVRINSFLTLTYDYNLIVPLCCHENFLQGRQRLLKELQKYLYLLRI